jgi:hypothetical protein
LLRLTTGHTKAPSSYLPLGAAQHDLAVWNEEG